MSETTLGRVGGADADGTISTVRDAIARDLFLALSKALRAFQIYDERNPVYQKFVSGLKDAFGRLWSTENELTVEVEESRILLDGVAVYANENRSESLAFLFYKDGVRELTFLPGIEREELPRFLSVLHRVRFVGPADDVLTMLWEEGLQSFRYQYIDYLSEGVELPEPGEGAEPEQLSQAHEDELKEAQANATLQLVDLDSFNPTLYALDPREMERLDQELKAEMGRALRADVMSALFDRLEESFDVQRQSEIISVLRTLLPNLLGRGLIDAAGAVLRELRTLEATPGIFDAERGALVKQLFDEVSAPAVMSELVKALEDGSINPTPPALGEFLLNLQPQALPWLLRASETAAVKELRPVLRGAVEGIAKRNRTLLVGLVSSEDPMIASGAARLAGALQVGEAAAAIQKLLRHYDPGARLAAVEAASLLRASTVVGAVPEALTDEDRQVRIAAARALGSLRYAPAAARFRTLLGSKEMRAADITEKIAFFEGYADLGDPEAVTVLDKLLNARGLLGRREPSEVRAAAALALGRIASPDARKALQASSKDDDAVVRSAVGRALRGGREAER